MRRLQLFILLLLVFVPVISYAQVQKGYVRTVGRPDNRAGERLSGVTIRIRGQHAAVVSAGNGEFNFDLQGGKSSYRLSSVGKSGYELNEKEVIGREFGVTMVAHEIVMVSQSEKEKIKDRVREQVEKRYQERVALLEKQLKEKTISAEKHDKLYAELESVYDKRDQLVDDMVERYSHTDYAVITDLEAEINSYIESGELEKADSIVNTLDIAKIERNRDALAHKIDIVEQGLNLDKQSKAKMDSTLLIAYNAKIEIFSRQFQHDSLEYYLDKLVALDKTNDKNLCRASYLYLYNLIDYNKALELASDVANMRIAAYGENSVNVAYIYGSIGNIYEEKGDYKMALEYLIKYNRILLDNLDEDNPDLAMSFVWLANGYMVLGEHAKAIPILEKTLAMAVRIYGEEQEETAWHYFYIAAAYEGLGNDIKMLEYNEKALEILKKIYGEDGKPLADIYETNAVVYLSLEEFDKAFTYYDKAFKINATHKGKYNENTASCLRGLANYFKKTKDYNSALQLYEEALEIEQKINKEYHPIIAETYNEIGSVYEELGEVSKAISYYEKALEIQFRIYGEVHRDIAHTYNCIAGAYLISKDFPKSIEYYKKALDIDLKVYGEKHINVSREYEILINIYQGIKDYINAAIYAEKQLSVNILLYGELAPVTVANYSRLISLYELQGNSDKELEYILKAIEIQKQIADIDPIDIANHYYRIGCIYYEKALYSDALNSLNEGLKILKAQKTENAICQSEIYTWLGIVYSSTEEYDKAIKNFDNALKYASKSEDINSSICCNIRYYMYSCLDKYEKSKLQKYMKDKVCTMTFLEGGLSSERGYSGECYILELGDWTIESNDNLYTTNSNLQGKPKYFVFMQDGKIYSEYFEDKIGAVISIKQITDEERQRVLNQYRDWKILQ